MVGLSRPVVVTTASVGVAATYAGVAGFWVVGDAPPGLAQYAAVSIGAGLLGAFVLWHRPGNRYGLTHLVLSALFGSITVSAATLAHGSAVPAWVAQVVLAWSWISLGLLLPLWVVVIAAFPDGRFHRPWLRRANVGLGGAVAVLGVLCYLLFPPGHALPLIQVIGPAGPLAGPESAAVFDVVAGAGAVLGVTAPVLAVLLLADRYRKADVVVRQQIKWLLVGVVVSVAVQAFPVAVIDSELLRTTARVLVVLAVPLPMLAAALAIFRYGLWEIDLVVSRALAYVLLSIALSVPFVGLALTAGISVGGADAQVVAAVGLAVLVSHLARPVRRRLVALLVRLMYGEAPRGPLALSRFSEGAAPRLTAQQHADQVVEVTESALGAPTAAVWVFVPGGEGGVLRPLAGDDAADNVSVMVPDDLVSGLRNLTRGVLLEQAPPELTEVIGPLVGSRADALAAMVVSDQLIGVLTCVRRVSDPWTESELELLGILARDAALTLQNFQMERELEQRLELIERQAAALRSSRQRLVTAQDHERRRIERDLHDGAQQLLVSLAARLRRALQHPPEDLGEELLVLADQAEDAVFALQELARGIYPSVLAASGLYPALRAHAARLPERVSVEVAPGLRGRRLTPELEATLYYVALEALTNAAKHASGATIGVQLRAGSGPGSVVLEVHDDGPGFTPRAGLGKGLQNMADRMDAVGGTLSIQSSPGAGTWVRAEVHEPASVTRLGDAGRSRASTTAPPPHAG